MIRIVRLIFYPLILAVCFVSTASSDPRIDIVHYSFHLTLTDSDDTIDGVARIEVHFLGDTREFALDLIGPGDDNKGMTVRDVSSESGSLSFSQDSDRLVVSAEEPFRANSRQTFTVRYSGIPRDGLIISTNKHGERTFFGDNWPNRARNWLPVVDDPSDKATVEFAVSAPPHYQVISNGRLAEEIDTGDGNRLTRWVSDIPLPTKVMVIGVARFAVDHVGVTHSVPIQSWVYPQEQEEGFHDYEIARPILEYFINTIGPFPYEKLANVQSKTIYGGMENAGAIFYHENSIDGNRSAESLFAHEIAHQWFGDSVTEQDFHHIWLSEGFATYLTQLYLEHRYGTPHINGNLVQQREAIIAYANRNPDSPVVDTTITVLTDLLSVNSYQKGGWILHMLRREVGDEAFHGGLRRYYMLYRDGNAWTSDFQAAIEHTSDSDLDWFFDQWIFTPSLPEVSVNWSYEQDTQSVVVDVRQTHPGGYVYQLPVEIGFSSGSGETETHAFRMSAATGRYAFPVAFEPADVTVDPNVNLLAAITVENQ